MGRRRGAGQKKSNVMDVDQKSGRPLGNIDVRIETTRLCPLSRKIKCT